MLDFQKEHNIRNHCVSNSILLRDFLKSRGLNTKVKAVISEHCVEEEKRMVLTCHMVVEIEEETVVDPSYDICRYNAIYMDNISIVMERLKKRNPNAKEEGLSVREAVSRFIEFIKDAEEINNSKKYTCNEYMIKQLKYIKNYIKNHK